MYAHVCLSVQWLKTCSSEIAAANSMAMCVIVPLGSDLILVNFDLGGFFCVLARGFRNSFG